MPLPKDRQGPYVRALKFLAGLGAALLLLALLAAWQLPSRLDWNRYHGAIASFASARMGRPVTIGGQIRLQLLPEAVLVADGVKLADRGDGVSATIGALRLRVSLPALLRGRLVPRRLELDDPVVVLPWPLPHGAVTPVARGVAGGFSASVEGGSLRLGGVTLSGITGGVQVDPDTGAFAAQGAAGLGGRPWRFTSLIGAPGADGISLLTVALDGQGAIMGAGGTLRGRILASGSVQGMLVLRGDNLAHLLPAPALPWRLRGKVEAAQGAVRAPQLELVLGQSPGAGSATLLLGAAPELNATAHIGQIPIDGWVQGLLAGHTTLPVHLDLAATAGTMMRGTVRDMKAVIDLGRQRTVLKAEATLPGGAALRLEGAAGQQPTDSIFVGGVTLTAPELAPVIGWLEPTLNAAFHQGAGGGELIGLTGPGLTGPGLIGPAKLAGTLHLAPDQLALTGLAGSIGGTGITGHINLATQGRPTVTATLALDHLVLPGPPGDVSPALRAAAHLAGGFAGTDTTLDIQLAHGQFGPFPFTNAILQAQGTASGLALHRLAADLGTAHLEASGAIGRDGAVNDGRLDITAPDAAKLKLPSTWHFPPASLWQGPVHLGLVAAGPPNAIAGQIRADLGDLRAEAETLLDTTAALLTATLTVRHPGAPRLAAQLGISGGTDYWPGAGSVAILAHVAASPGAMAIKDFSIAAGPLRLSGEGSADFTTAEPTVTAKVQAGNLVLPAAPTGAAPLPLWVLQGWQGRIQLATDQMRFGPALSIAQAAGTLTVTGGAALAEDIAANVAGGRFTGQAAIDTALPYPAWAVRGTLTGAPIDQLPALPGFPAAGGTANLDIDLSAKGSSATALLATVSGTANGSLQNASLTGVDLSRAGKVLLARGPHLRAALTASLSSGDSGPLAGGFDSTLADGTVTVTNALFTASAGSVGLAGAWDLPAADAVVRLRVLPSVPAPPLLTILWSGGHRSVDAQPGLAWATAKKQR